MKFLVQFWFELQVTDKVKVTILELVMQQRKYIFKM